MGKKVLNYFLMEICGNALGLGGLHYKCAVGRGAMENDGRRLKIFPN
jgi:hypothetical protein